MIEFSPTLMFFLMKRLDRIEVCLPWGETIPCPEDNQNEIFQCWLVQLCGKCQTSTYVSIFLAGNNRGYLVSYLKNNLNREKESD